MRGVKFTAHNKYHEDDDDIITVEPSTKIQMKIAQRALNEIAEVAKFLGPENYLDHLSNKRLILRRLRNAYRDFLKSQKKSSTSVRGRKVQARKRSASSSVQRRVSKTA